MEGEKTDKNEKKITVRFSLKGLGNLQIEGDEKSISEILERLRVSALHTKKTSRPFETGGQANKIYSHTISGQIQRLIDDSFFKRPKSLKEIIKELERLGFNYPASSVSPVLLNSFIRKSRLKRNGKKGGYVYYVNQESV
jgi:hypothetical protein